MGAGGAAGAEMGEELGRTPIWGPCAGAPTVLGPDATKLVGAEAGCPPVPTATSCTGN